MFKGVKDNLLKAYEMNKKSYDKRARVVEYKEGERVWRNNDKKSRAIEGIAQKLLPKYYMYQRKLRRSWGN